MKIALTGAQGFTGLHFAARAREAGHAVLPLSCNLTDRTAVGQAVAEVEDVDAVVHLAAISFVGHSDNRAFYDVNLFGTLNLLDALAAARTPPRRVLIASSANVYGNWGERPVSEDRTPAPVNHYAMSKLAMEHMSRTYRDRLPLTIVRPFNYTGPGQHLQFVIPKLVDHFRRRAPVVKLGNTQVEREYNDVRFVCEAYLRLLQREHECETFNVCTGRTYHLMGVIALLRELTGHAIEVETDPALVRANEVHRLCGDPSRLNAAIGELPGFELEQTLAWMLAQP